MNTAPEDDLTDRVIKEWMHGGTDYLLGPLKIMVTDPILWEAVRPLVARAVNSFVGLHFPSSVRIYYYKT